jgi:RND family efflux transporter MFP subunit
MSSLATMKMPVVPNGNGHPPAAQVHAPAAVPGRGTAGRRVPALGALAAVVLAGALAAGTLPRLREEQAVKAAAAQAAAAPPRVTVAPARAGAAESERVLRGSAMALCEAAIHSRASGYVKSQLVDIGDRVREGQVLAVVSAPDIDAQLVQARASLELARANLERARAYEAFARGEERRYGHLVAGRASSREEYEGKVEAAQVARAAVAAAAAEVRVNEAAVQRCTDLQSFEQITAPFAGVITARHVHAGDLVTADTTGKELFHLMCITGLRVFVDVPQALAPGVRVGQSVAVYRREDPARQYPGTVTRTANALDPGTRTLLTEVQVPNPAEVLRPGMYLQVKFVTTSDVVPVLIPAAALATRSGGPRVAVLDGQRRVHYRTVQLGRDYGADIEVLDGLAAGETVVLHAGDDLPEGTLVEPVSPGQD